MGSLDDHLHACEEAELSVLLVDPAYAARAAELLEASDAVGHVFTFGPADVGRDITALAEEAAPARLDGTALAPDDICWLLYTGGTTGVPKAAMLTAAGMAQMVWSVSTGWDLPRDIRYLACAPITHAAGMLVTPTLLAGGSVVLHRAFDPERWIADIAAERITTGLLVPTMIYTVLDHPSLDGADLSSLETVMYGASPMSPTRMVEAMERIGPVFAQLYGQTECAGIGTSLWRHQHDPNDLTTLTACGQAMPGARVAVLDDNGNHAAPGEPGEISIQGRTVMLGYWRQPELTASTLVDGWLRTGALATVAESGTYTIVDRRKDMIVSGGFNVVPREIEDVLSTHPGVAICAVIGVPDDRWGEAVTAVVVPRPGAEVDVEELRDLVRARKGAIHVPKRVELVEAMPMTAVGKADKKVLRRTYWGSEARQVH
jgi:fatty-acyl-CoA synthase